MRLKQEMTFPGGRELKRNRAGLPVGEDWHAMTLVGWLLLGEVR